MLSALGLGLKYRFPFLASGIPLDLNFLDATASSGSVSAATTSSANDPTFTFTRSSVATALDADGVLQEVAANVARVGTNNRKPVTNLLKYPGNLDNTDVWTAIRASVSDGQTDPFGGTDAFKLIENATTNTHYIDQESDFVSGKTYTYSAIVAPDERNWCRILFPTTAFPSNAFCWFNVSTGEKGTFGGNADAAGIAPIEGTAFYRIWVTATADATTNGNFLFNLGSADNTASYEGDDTSGLYIYMPMLNEGGIEDCVGTPNLLDDVQDFSAWNGTRASITTNSTTAPDGSTTADTFADANGGGTLTTTLYKAVTLPEAGTYTFNIIAKEKQLSWVCVQQNLFDGGLSRTWFDIGNGVVGTDANSGEIVGLGNGFYQCTIKITSTTDLEGQISIILSDADGDTTVDQDGTSDIYLAAAWLTKGDTVYPAPCYPQTGFVKAGYTAEAAATNLITDSEDLSAGSWAVGGGNSVTITTNQSAAPDGTTTLDKIAVTDTTNEVHFLQGSAISYVAGTDYTISGYFRAGELRYIGLYFSATGFPTSDRHAYFDLLEGTATAQGTAIAGIKHVGHGLYRCWLTQTAIATNSSPSGLYLTEGAFADAFVGTSGDGVYAGGFQLETGTYPSSYIKTSGSTATRAADSLSTTDMSWYNESEGTFVAGISLPQSVATNARYFDVSLNTSNRVLLYNASSNFRLFVRNAATTVAQVDSATNILEGQNHVAAAYKTDDFHVANEGTLTLTPDTSGIPPAGLTTLYIGRGVGGNHINGSFKTFTYYNTRKTDAELETFSTQDDPGTRWLSEMSA